MRVKMTYGLAMAAGKDAANRAMRAAGRSRWNEDDYNAMWAEFNRLFPVEVELAQRVA